MSRSGSVFSFLLEIIAAFIVWVFKGFKGRLVDEIAGPHDTSWKSWRNLAISLFFILIVLAIVSKVSEKAEKEHNRIIIEVGR